MPWTHAQLKTADGALGIADPSASAAALNAQTVVLTGQDTQVLAVQDILLASAAAEWAKIVIRSRAALTGTATDAAIMAAITAVALADAAAAGGTKIIQTSVPAVAAQFDAMLGALQSVGDVSAASVTAIQALRSVVVPAWMPPVDAGLILLVRAMP